MSSVLVKTLDKREATVDIQSGWSVKNVADAVEQKLNGSFRLYYKVIQE